MGVVDARQVHARPDLVGSAQSDGQRQRQALRLAGILDRPDADPRSQDAHGDRLQDAGARSEHAAVARARPRRQRRACRRRRAYWGDRQLWDTRANNHNAMFDEQRPRVERRERPRPAQSGFLQGEIGPSVGQAVPAQRQAAGSSSILDPKTMQYTFVDTCFGTHHLQFDKNNILWVSGSGPVAGWLDAKMFDETGDAMRVAGLGAVRARHQRQRQARRMDRAGQAGGSRTRTCAIGGSGPYAVMPNPADGSVWYTFNVFGGPGGVLRYDPKTQLSELYPVPMPGFSPRGGDIDSQGVVWVVARLRATSARSTAASARARSTDRRRPATIARKAGRSTSIRDQASATSGRTARRRATTPGSTSTTQSGSAATCRSRPPISMTASPRW